MKRMIYLSLFLIFTFTFVNAATPYGIEGVYSNFQTYTEIEVDVFSKGIRIRGLDQRHPYKWNKFRRLNRFVFSDGRGLEIKIKERDRYGEPRLLVRNRRGNIIVYNRGVLHSGNRSHTSCTTIINHSNDWDDYDSYYDDRVDRRRYNNQDRFDNNRNERNNGFSNERENENLNYGRLEGTYQTKDGRYIAVLETREGFKAKFKGEKNWKNYMRQNDKFVDKDGNYYRKSDVNELIWSGKYSGNTIVIKKIDDKVQF